MNLPEYAHISDSDLEAIRDIIMDGLKGFDIRVFVFGSVARGEFGMGSDVDIAFMSEDGIPAEVIGGVREKLEESTIPYTVDLVDLATFGTSLREAILAEAIEWSV